MSYRNTLKPGQKPDFVTVRAMRSESEPSLPSRETVSFGPSNKEPALITSKWTIGWQTPTLMIASYALALAIAIAHLLFFRYLDGREADRPNRVAPQAYITTASNILANAFGFALRASLAVAFCQYLWRLFRAQAMKVSTIELLYSIRTNPFQLFQIAVLRAAPTLCALAAIMWLSQIASSFPPGAITITTAQRVEFSSVSVPTFNASYMGNGSGAEANANSLNRLVISETANDFVSGEFNSRKSSNQLSRLARQVLVAGEAFPVSSPCGMNCSYTTQFEAPYFECNKTTKPSSHRAQDTLNVYSGLWFAPTAPKPAIGGPRYNGTYTLANFNSTTLTPVLISNNTGNATEAIVTVDEENTICAPGRAKYTVHNIYENNIRTQNFTREPIDRLVNLALATRDGAILVPNFTLNRTRVYGTTPANWTKATLDIYRDNNMMAILSAMMSWLHGDFQASLAQLDNDDTRNVTFKNAWHEAVFFEREEGVLWSDGANNEPLFNITADMLNDYVFNATTSVMAMYRRWNTTANATTSTTLNVYSFSEPLNLIIPYFLTLLVSLPFVVMGCLALMKNGVSATDGGFMQLITTNTGSAIVDKAAAGGCLGGDESAPQELKDLEIRFGEFIGRDEPGRIKRAGFGVDSELTSLTKGADYGIARWI
ncbi:hypothetical protein ONS95_012450 [Cadophora gregata]|uniref:uncharacterized protein n=1 Tax=Cadophora gregata TaxID=51156 RepID=UPI0026DCEBBF|nr:uncharacterized protein ONS95_012450 [Cadophora gregata]KAK0118144.1 hypothetical protein ONS95_012450 [Cadophora gregata]